MSLPPPWVDKIFEKLTLTYGHLFLGRWSGLDIAAVKADWGHELSRLQQNPRAIQYGLENLPEGEPPTVLQFRSLCNRRPDGATPLLRDGTRPDPRRVAAALARVDLRLETVQEKAVRCFARLRHLRDTGQASAGQLDFLKRAEANMDQRSVEAIGDFVPIPEWALPPGMRAEKARKTGGAEHPERAFAGEGLTA